MRGDLSGRVAGPVLFVGALVLSSCAGEAAPPSSPDAALTPASAAAAPPGPAPTAAASAVSPSLPPAGPAASAPAPGDRQGELRALIQANRAKFRACYDEARQRVPTLRGSFVVDFTLNPDGTMKQAAYARDKSEIKDEKMGDCAVAALRSIGFPPSGRGMETTVSYPFGFTPGGGGAP